MAVVDIFLLRHINFSQTKKAGLKTSGVSSSGDDREKSLIGFKCYSVKMSIG